LGEASTQVSIFNTCIEAIFVSMDIVWGILTLIIQPLSTMS
jgi:hypothetical protein